MDGSEYKTVSPGDLTTLTESLGDPAKRTLLENENKRKQLIESYKKSFSLAQAAEAEGIQKTDKFIHEFGLMVDRLLANEYGKRNPDLTISEKELDEYYNAHEEEFEADFKSIFEGQPQRPDKDLMESFKTYWNNLKVRSEKARQGGIDQEKSLTIRVKFDKAQLLDARYTKALRKRFQPTPEEKAEYITEHPEADLEQVKQKAEGILERLKQGESFEKLADETNEDGTKGKGGDLNWVARGRTIPEFQNAAFLLEKDQIPEFENAAFALEKGQTSDLVKTRYGYHIIRVDDKREVKPKVWVFEPGWNSDPGTVEEIHLRHILISTREVDRVEQRLIDEKVKKALDEIETRYPVNAPADFPVALPLREPNENEDNKTIN